jgi:hypothetical protein
MKVKKDFEDYYTIKMLALARFTQFNGPEDSLKELISKLTCFVGYFPFVLSLDNEIRVIKYVRKVF